MMTNVWRRRENGHYYLVIITILVAIFGIVMQYSASMYSAGRDMNDPFYYVKKQSFALVIGVIVMLCTSRLDTNILKKYRYHMLIVSYILLALVFVPHIGVEKYGAKRWINLGFITIQPSEIAKMVLVIFLASEMASKSTTTIRSMLPSLIALAIMCVLIMLEPNMSITMCVGIVAFIMLYLGGMRARHFAMFGIPIMVGVVLLIILEPYRLKRLMAFLDPWASPQGEGYQLIQSYYALGSGGLFGVGLFNSRQKYLFLPFAESDFVFSIVGEELGLFGSTLLLVMIMSIVVYGIVTAIGATTRFDAYLAAGISVLIAVQSLLNIAVVTGSIPPTGLPLPLVSHGGSSLVVYMAGIGLIRGVRQRSSTNNAILHTIK